MKKILLISLAVVLALSLGIIGCDGGTTGPIELTMSHWMSEMHPMHRFVMEPFADAVANQTEGRVTITIYSGGALGGPGDHYNMAVTGISDISFGIQGYTAGVFPLTSVVELPNMVTNASMGSSVLWDLYETFPEIQAEYTGVKVLSLWTHDAGQVMTTPAAGPVNNLTDFSGMTIRAPTSAHVDMVNAWGATAVYMPISELYTNLETDLIEGCVTAYSAVKSFNLVNVIDYITEGDFYVAAMFLVMNLASWNSISASDQAIIEGLIGSTMSETAGAAYDSGAAAGRALAVANNLTINVLPPGELAVWEAATASLHTDWIDAVETLLLPGQDVYDEALSLIAAYP